MPKRMRLTDAGIAKLRAQAREYTVWDTRVGGLGVRVRPSGGRSYVWHCKSAGGTTRKSLGSTLLRSVEEVRRECLASAAVTVASDARKPTTAPLFRDFVAGPWKTASLDRCRPSTRRSYESVLQCKLLPAFGSRRLDRITRIMAVRWFETWSGTAPGNANCAIDLLRQILNHAIACGHIATNPVRGIKRNPRPKLTRFLSREEISRLHRTLDDHDHGTPSRSQQADIIRLLLLTGCRKSEIVRLRRDEVKGDRLELHDSKTGPRAVLLNDRARKIVEHRMARGNGFWVFPSVKDPSRHQDQGIALWYRVRREAGIEDVRLHDLRHTVASQAAMAGVPLPVVARLLGHSDVRMTMHYAHIGDAEIEAAAERVGRAIADMMGIAKLGVAIRPSRVR